MRSEAKMQRETPNFCETDEGGEEFLKIVTHIAYVQDPRKQSCSVETFCHAELMFSAVMQGWVENQMQVERELDEVMPSTTVAFCLVMQPSGHNQAMRMDISERQQREGLK